MNIMNIRTYVPVLFCISWGMAAGQRPAPIQINNLISRIPLPVSSQLCYASCTTTRDPADGVTHIKDNGPQFNSLNEEADKIGKMDMEAMKSSYANAQSTAASSVPNAEQIAQMQAEGMQRAQQAMQNGGSPAQTAPSASQPRSPANHVAFMQELGKAQSSIMQITQLTNELSTKMSELRMAEVPMGPNCPEVRQGSYVGPTCSCTKDHSVDYEQRRVSARDKYLQQVNELLRQYIPRIKDQVALVDKVETDSGYGQSVNDPSTIQMLWVVQRQAMNGFASLMGIAGGTWSDGANQYLNLVNARNKTCP
jgi:hypothetical protein